MLNGLPCAVKFKPGHPGLSALGTFLYPKTVSWVRSTTKTLLRHLLLFGTPGIHVVILQMSRCARVLHRNGDCQLPAVNTGSNLARTNPPDRAIPKTLKRSWKAGCLLPRSKLPVMVQASSKKWGLEPECVLYLPGSCFF